MHNMPVHSGKDSKGSYMQWGGKGAKYRYTPGDPDSKGRARAKAQKQGAAAHANGYTGN